MTLSLVALLLVGPPASTPDLRLWYRQPAEQWNQALPVGNGRLGAMVYGRTADETIQLNEETLWSGGPYDPVVPGASNALPEIRRLLFSGDIPAAHDLFGRSMMGRPYEQMKYHPLGNLRLSFPGHERATAYRRELDLDTAIARVSYRIGDAQFTRERFSSAAEQVLVVRLTSDRPGKLTCTVELTRVERALTRAVGADQLAMQGQLINVPTTNAQSSSPAEAQNRGLPSCR